MSGEGGGTPVHSANRRRHRLTSIRQGRGD